MLGSGAAISKPGGNTPGARKVSIAKGAMPDPEAGLGKENSKLGVLVGAIVGMQKFG